MISYDEQSMRDDSVIRNDKVDRIMVDNRADWEVYVRFGSVETLVR